MTLLRPTAEAACAGRAVRRPGTGRALTVLALLAVGALVPLLGPAAALHGTGETAAPGTAGVALLRTALFAALAVPLGELFVERLARGLPGAPADRPRDWTPYALGVGFLAALGLALVVASGSPVTHHLTGMDVGGLRRTRDGLLALFEVNAFLVAGLCALSRRPGTRLWPLAAVIVAEALRAHPPAEYFAPAGSLLTLVHLTCAALWAGGLLHALRVLRRWRSAGTAGAALLGRYARVAAALFAAVTATGVCSTLRRMPSGTLLDHLATTAYGRALLAKVLLVAAAALLALAARGRLRRATGAAERGGPAAPDTAPPPDLPTARTPLTAYAPARAEIAALGVAVALSGLLTALPLPAR
ncbi:CopD family protein [Streptomyces sp. NPDC090306]|uniref:CopD family protein n=1 Tax=Streptomyces sp. NPDC090306 TaxID=3365961 RepID=UPI0038124F1E